MSLLMLSEFALFIESFSTRLTSVASNSLMNREHMDVSVVGRGKGFGANATFYGRL